MNVLVDLLARALLDLNWLLRLYGEQTRYADGSRSLLTRWSKMSVLSTPQRLLDAHAQMERDVAVELRFTVREPSQLIVWRQDFPGADLDVISDVTAPLMAHLRT